jgi:predicted transcriptional regulator
VPSARRADASRSAGLSVLRRPGAVSDLLFLYECTTREVGQLRPIADRLGLTVQAASHTFRSLARRGLVDQREGRYRPTVAGVDWLHRALGSLHEDLTSRLDRLNIVRTTRAIAGEKIPAGASVALAIEDGVLVAVPGRRGAARGRAAAGAAAGELVEIADLDGIVPLQRGAVTVVVLPEASLASKGLYTALRMAIGPDRSVLLAAQGIEAVYLARKASGGRPIIRFGIAATVAEATLLGVDCTIVVTDRQAPHLLEQLRGPIPPTVLVLGSAESPKRRSPRR